MAKLKIMMPKMPSETNASGINSAVCLMRQKKMHRQTDTAAMALKAARSELSRETMRRIAESVPMTGVLSMPAKADSVS